MSKLKTSLIALGFAALAVTPFALKQDAPVTVKAMAPTAVHGKQVVAKVVFDIPMGFHIYSPTFAGVGTPASASLAKPVSGLSTAKLHAKGDGELSGTATMYLPIMVAKSVRGTKHLMLKVRFQQCNDRICLPPTTKEIPLVLHVK